MKLDKAIYRLIGDKLRKERDRKGYSLEYVADKVGLTKKTIQRYETAESRITVDTLKKICRVLNIDPDTFISHFVFDFNKTNVTNDEFENTEIIKNHETKNCYPLYSSISCGSASFVNDSIEEYIALPESLINSNYEYFCQYAKGDSMIGENIQSGDLIVFKKTNNISNGKVGCFCVDHNEATCKKFYHDKNSGIITLQAANPKYDPIIITVDTMHFRVIGELALVINKR